MSKIMLLHGANMPINVKYKTYYNIFIQKVYIQGAKLRRTVAGVCYTPTPLLDEAFDSFSLRETIAFFVPHFESRLFFGKGEGAGIEAF